MIIKSQTCNCFDKLRGSFAVGVAILSNSFGGGDGEREFLYHK